MMAFIIMMRKNLFLESFSKLKSGGIYIIEDVTTLILKNYLISKRI